MTLEESKKEKLIEASQSEVGEDRVEESGHRE